MHPQTVKFSIIMRRSVSNLYDFILLEGYFGVGLQESCIPPRGKY